MQRRLANYILSRSKELNFFVVMTTHSGAIIDFISQQESTSIVHVTHNGQEASASYVETLSHGHDLIDDLGIRASDLLQSNCIIWLEGPSDRIYFNRWIELESEGKIKEGLHYQCLYYGGKILSHFSFNSSDDASSDLLTAIRVNRNSIVIMDSDKRAANGRINATKARVAEELESRGFSWVTAGREVENYIPQKVLDAYVGKSKITLGRYDDIKDYLNSIEKDRGTKFERAKVLFAREVAPLIEHDDIKSCLDLSDMIKSAIKYIKKCNGSRF